MSRKWLQTSDNKDNNNIVYQRKQQVTAALPGISSLVQTKTTDGFIKPRSKEEVKIVVPTINSQSDDLSVKD